MTDRTAYGGQAVIEGVMIRGKEHAATAVRLRDGSITVRREAVAGWSTSRSWLRLAFIRGLPALADSLRLGYRTLMWSADQVMEGEEQQKMTPLQYFLTILVTLGFAIGVFVLLPTYALKWVFPAAETHANLTHNILAQLIPTPAGLARNIAEGMLRLLMLVGYILAIGHSKEIRRVFAYHGAEHKVVNAYEAGAELNVAGCRTASRIHPRCGTSFLFLVFVVGIIVHALIGWPAAWLRLVSRLVLLPIVVGASYELIRLAGRKRDSLVLRVLVWPGMLLQRLTTAEPSDDQIEVAIASLRTVLADEGVEQPEAPAITVAPELSCAGA